MMKRALELAGKCCEEVPVGAVIVKDGDVIASAWNMKELGNDVTAHAEILCLRDAANKLGRWRLEDCEMYVTLEPCPMCAWAIINSRLKAVYFGAYDSKYGALGSATDLRKLADSSLKVYGGIMEEECSDVIKKWFSLKRVRM